MKTAIKQSEIENQIARYKDIVQHIKMLEVEKDNLRNALVASYFSKKSEYKDKNGILLATYHSQIRVTFDTKRFKEEQPKLYNKYSNESEIHVFLVK